MPKIPRKSQAVKEFLNEYDDDVRNKKQITNEPGQARGENMAGGQKMNDFGGMPHTSDMAMKSKNSVKNYSSAEGAGTESEYEDTSEAIKSQQMMGTSKAKAHPLKSGYRN